MFTHWERTQRRRALEKTVRMQECHEHRTGTISQMRGGYLRMACTDCGATIALYSWRRRHGAWELELTYYFDGSV